MAAQPSSPTAAPTAEHLSQAVPVVRQVRPVRGVPDATVARLPVYLRALSALHDRGTCTVSSEELACLAGVTPAKLRKDLSFLGSYGTRGVGYDVDHLIHHVTRELGLREDRAVIIIGVGHLGHALAGYSGFSAGGFHVAALLDADPVRRGEVVAGLGIRGLDELEPVVAQLERVIAVVAVPPSAAQEVCDRLVACGVRSILNFAPTPITVPGGVDLRRVDLSVELQILAFHEQRRSGLDALLETAAPEAGARA